MENRDYIVAIDLGSSNVVVMVGSRATDGKIHIEDFAIKESQGVIRGEIKNIELVAKAIKETIEEVEQKLDIKITDVYTGISGQHIKCAKNSYYVYVGRDGEIRDEDVQRLNESMRNVQAPEGEKILHIIPQNYIVNDEEEVANPVGMFGQKLEATFNFIIGDNVIISRLEKALGKVDIGQVKMFLNPLVLSEAVALEDEKELGVAIVDIGAGTTDICIYHDNIVRYVGVVPIGADSINKDIRSYGILERYVEDLKVRYGSAIAEKASAETRVKVPGRTSRDPKEISFQNLAAIIEARMLDIADYIMAEIKNAGYEGKLAAGLVLTGGCAQLKEVDTLFKNYTGLDVRIASPDLKVDQESKEIAIDTRLSTVIGILLKGMESDEVVQAQRVRVAARPRPSTTQAQNIFKPKHNTTSRPLQTEPKGQLEDQQEAQNFDHTPEKGDKKEKKGGFIKKIFGGITDMFDVIDDNEI